MADDVSASYVTTYSNARESVDLYEKDTTSSFFSKRSDQKTLFENDVFPRSMN